MSQAVLEKMFYRVGRKGMDIDIKEISNKQLVSIGSEICNTILSAYKEAKGPKPHKLLITNIWARKVNNDITSLKIKRKEECSVKEMNRIKKEIKKAQLTPYHISCCSIHLGNGRYACRLAYGERFAYETFKEFYASEDFHTYLINTGKKYAECWRRYINEHVQGYIDDKNKIFESDLTN